MVPDAVCADDEPEVLEFSLKLVVALDDVNVGA
jgi:hypothetical protein